MGYALQPEFYKAAECAYHSKNPILPGEILLDTYYVTIQDKDKTGEVVGEREIPCVTHESLMRYYRENLMPRGMRISYDVVSVNPMVCKCTIQKRLSKKDKKLILETYPDADEEDLDYDIHIEALGEATLQNSKSEIAQTHLANTAENRAFDRAMIKFLSLDAKEQVYGSSDEIGEDDSDVKKAPVQKDWLDRAKEQIQSEQIRMDLEPVADKRSESAPVPAHQAVTQPAVSRENTINNAAVPAQKAAKVTLGTPISPIQKLIAAINCLERTEGYEKVLDRDVKTSEEVFSEKPLRSIIDALNTPLRDKAVKVLNEVVKRVPENENHAKSYLCMIHNMIDLGHIKFEGQNVVVI